MVWGGAWGLCERVVYWVGVGVDGGGGNGNG